MLLSVSIITSEQMVSAFLKETLNNKYNYRSIYYLKMYYNY